MHYKYKNAMATAVMLIVSMDGLAAERIDLKNHQNTILKILDINTHSQDTLTTLQELNRYTDLNQMTHVRMQEYFRGYRIWNAQAVIHIPEKNAKKLPLSRLLLSTPDTIQMNGQLYKKLAFDLDKTPSTVFNKQQAERGLQTVISIYRNKTAHKNAAIKNSETELLVYIDKHDLAHWAFQISFDSPASNPAQLPTKPVYIIDAVDFSVYQTWDNIKTSSYQSVMGGGLGGNVRSGKLFYDNLQHHLAAFKVTKDADICYFENEDTLVKNAMTKAVMHYPCTLPDQSHNQIYWSGDFDNINQGYSPANDAMFAAQVIKEFYKQWYQIAVLKNPDQSEMRLEMNVHVPKMDNAYWDGKSMTFGDGTNMFPLTSLNIAAHEVSHGFTEQHSNLNYTNQSGGMNEAFSDMAGQIAEYYAYGSNHWTIGSEVLKMDGEALRYMDKPSKDCFGKEPGTYCSIDSAEQYYEGLDVHFSSGVYNRAFYLLSTTQNWNPRKAFAVMLHANASYWLAQTEFAEGAACAVKAAEDLQLDAQAVKHAFQTVGIIVPDRCTN